MAKANVVMNGAVLPLEEFSPEAWDGVPVTISHPVVNGEAVSATSPSQFSNRVGHIFNTHVDGVNLKAEAYINIDRAEALAPGLVQSLLDGIKMDVSTGYFADDEQKRGTLNGRQYNYISHNVTPNHLALLPDEEGACSWADGCGVRTNQRESEMSSLKKIVQIAINKAITAHFPAFVGNDRGKDDDRVQIVADLISSDATPFKPDDAEALNLMTDASLLATRDAYLGKPADAEEVTDNEDDAVDDEDQYRVGKGPWTKPKGNSDNILYIPSMQQALIERRKESGRESQASTRKSVQGQAQRFQAQRRAKMSERYPSTDELHQNEQRAMLRRQQGAQLSNREYKRRAVKHDVASILPPSSIEQIKRNQTK